MMLLTSILHDHIINYFTRVNFVLNERYLIYVHDARVLGHNNVIR